MAFCGSIEKSCASEFVLCVDGACQIPEQQLHDLKLAPACFDM